MSFWNPIFRDGDTFIRKWWWCFLFYYKDGRRGLLRAAWNAAFIKRV